MLQKTFKLLGFTIFLAIFAFPLCSNGYEDGIIAIVNNELITYKDFRDYLKKSYVDMATSGAAKSAISSKMQYLEKEGIHRLIEEKLIISKAKILGIEARKEVIDKKIKEIIKRYPSKKYFMKTLLQYGGTLTDLRNKLSDQLLIQHMVDQEVRAKVHVNPKDVTEYYQNNKANFHSNESAEVDSIYIKFKETEGKEPSREKAKAAYRALTEEGKEFWDVSTQYSEGTSLGKVERDQLVPEIEKEIFSLKEGQISLPFEIDKGIYIFRLKKIIPEKLYSVDEANKEITDILYQKNYQQKLEEWLNTLKKNAYIEIKQE
ncbi:MAG: peptidyl-prolyl cis-trans isomerase [Candidatus Omnitrophica bacterium]|nr:peptidyl-prolyl cis-trans isomerase [Candidatus Omnitrophota bacterium]